MFTVRFLVLVFFIEGSCYVRKRFQRLSELAVITNQNLTMTRNYFSMAPTTIQIRMIALAFSTSTEAKWKPLLSSMKLMAVEWPHPRVRTHDLSRNLPFLKFILCSFFAFHVLTCICVFYTGFQPLLFK